LSNRNKSECEEEEEEDEEEKKGSKEKERKKRTLLETYICSYTFIFKVYTCSYVLLHCSISSFSQITFTYTIDNNVHIIVDLQFSSF